jgi:monoterpene epsilon-lactone hydrolase
MTSLQSQIVAKYIEWTRAKHWGSSKAVQASVQKRDAFCEPTKAMQKFGVTAHELDGHSYFEIPASRPSAPTIYYFHGGGYIHDIAPKQWNFAAALHQRIGARVVVPAYPIAPESTWKSAMAFVDAVVDLTASSPSNTSYCGDSAGGGMAYGLAMYRRDLGKSTPAHLALISPMLDATMTDPACESTGDRWLSPAGIREAGRLYAGEDAANAYVSPLNGSFEGLGHISLMIGTKDVFHPDCVTLVNRLRRADHPHAHVFAKDMIHVWPLLPIPEAQSAMEWLERQIRSTCR